MLETPTPSVHAAGTGHETLVAGVALFAERPAELVRFHEQVLRIAFTHRQHEDGREHWITDLGGVHVEIKALLKADGNPTPDAEGSEAAGVGRAELSFRVHGVPSAVARAIVAGGRVLQPATEHSWGTFAVVLDPEGNRLGLWEPLKTSDSTTEEQA